VISGGYKLGGIDTPASSSQLLVTENRSFAGDVGGTYREGWKVTVDNQSFEEVTLTVEVTCLIV